MTNHNDLPAGVELDRLVADAMGWDAHYLRRIYGSENNFSPSSQIDHAWEVVEALKTKDLFLTIYPRAECTHCEVFNYDGEVVVRRFKAATAPLAISRAALKAVSS